MQVSSNATFVMESGTIIANTAPTGGDTTEGEGSDDDETESGDTTEGGATDVTTTNNDSGNTVLIVVCVVVGVVVVGAGVAIIMLVRKSKSQKENEYEMASLRRKVKKVEKTEAVKKAAGQKHDPYGFYAPISAEEIALIDAQAREYVANQPYKGGFHPIR